ncbi:MAG TPA: hypothetical protein VJP88_04540 [Caulobacteraceae bacterium]|nr:hypothetical protein [Caulobacteraceae bacterium]
MQLTPTLLAHLNRVFDKDPGRFVALRIAYAGALTWTIADGVLTFTPGLGAPLVYDLSQFTLGQLVADLAGRDGFTVTYLDPERSGLSALVLLDGAGDLDAFNGDTLLGYTSLLWALFEAAATQLKALTAACAGAPAEMATTTGDGTWLDELGSYYGVTRQAGEADAQYGPRIIAQAVRPIANNVALEVAIQSYTGQPVTVEDVIVYIGEFPLYNGAINFDGTHTFNATGVPNYGLFDVTVTYDIVHGGDITSFLTTVTSIVNNLRAAGTHMRSLALSSAGTPISDTFTPPTDAVSVLAVAAAFSDAFTAPTDTLSTVAVSLAGLSDTLTPPTDTVGGSIYRQMTDSLGNPITDSLGNPILLNMGSLFV